MTRLFPLIVAACGFIPSAALTAAESASPPTNPTASESADPPLNSFQLRNPTKEHLTAEQLYDYKAAHKPMRENVGQLVLVDVVVNIARDVPVVDVELAGRVPDANSRLRAHIMNMGALTSKPPANGDRMRIEGIIVNEGYGAYMIYLFKIQLLKSKGT